MKERHTGLPLLALQWERPCEAIGLVWGLMCQEITSEYGTSTQLESMESSRDRRGDGKQGARGIFQWKKPSSIGRCSPAYACHCGETSSWNFTSLVALQGVSADLPVMVSMGGGISQWKASSIRRCLPSLLLWRDQQRQLARLVALQDIWAGLSVITSVEVEGRGVFPAVLNFCF